MTLHKDYDTNDTIRSKTVNMAADYIATVWEQSTPDKPFSRLFNRNGKRIRVSVNEERNGTDVLGGILADRSTDA